MNFEKRVWVGTIGLLAALGMWTTAAHARDPNKVRCRTSAMDGASLQVRYGAERREFRADFSAARPSGEFESRFAAEGFAEGGFETPYAPGDVLQVSVAGQLVGSIVLDSALSGALRFDEAADRSPAEPSSAQPFPANFPPFPPGTVTQVGALACTGQRR